MNPKVYQSVYNNIHNQKIKNFVIEVLKDLPDNLAIIPTAASGKFHPPKANVRGELDENGRIKKVGGLVWHVKRACWFANMFFKAYKWDEKDIRCDIVLAALILHDIAKKEKYNKGWEYPLHPITAVKMISKFKNLLPEKVYKLIAGCVHHHMGPWTPSKHRKDITNYNLLELITYHSDYLSAQKTIKLEL